MSAKPPFTPQIRLYQNWLHEHRGLSFDEVKAFDPNPKPFGGGGDKLIA